MNYTKQLKLIDYLRETRWTPHDNWQTDNSNGLHGKWSFAITIGWIRQSESQYRPAPHHWFKQESVNNFQCLTLTF